ncbi:hypothetical protein D3C81_1527240 [compost metagenome]
MERPYLSRLTHSLIRDGEQLVEFRAMKSLRRRCVVLHFIENLVARLAGGRCRAGPRQDFTTIWRSLGRGRCRGSQSARPTPYSTSPNCSLSHASISSESQPVAPVPAICRPLGKAPLFHEVVNGGAAQAGNGLHGRQAHNVARLLNR